MNNQRVKETKQSWMNAVKQSKQALQKYELMLFNRKLQKYYHLMQHQDDKTIEDPPHNCHFDVFANDLQTIIGQKKKGQV